MGYFATRAEAQRWVKILLPYYPDAFVDETRTLKPYSAADVHDLPVAAAANNPERRSLLS